MFPDSQRYDVSPKTHKCPTGFTCSASLITRGDKDHLPSLGWHTASIVLFMCCFFRARDFSDIQLAVLKALETCGQYEEMTASKSNSV